MMHKKSVLKWALVAMLSAGPVGGAMAQDVKFALEWLVSGRHAGVFAALENGFYRDEGLNVTIDRGFGSADTVKRVAAGAADFGIADVTTVLPAHPAKDAPIIIGAFTSGTPEALLVLKSSGVEKPQDLAGKRIGGGSASVTPKLLPIVAAEAGLTDYTFVPMASDQIYPALLTKQVDAITGQVDNITILGPLAREANDDVIAIPYAEYGVDKYATFIASAELVARKDPAIGKFLRASFKGIAWALANPEKAAAMVKKHAPITDEAVLLAGWEANRPYIDTPETREHGLGTMRAEKMRMAYDMSRQYLGLEKELNIKTIYTTEFLPEAPIYPHQ